ncbi:MAG: RNA polymerase sigma factor [bacterium]
MYVTIAEAVKSAQAGDKSALEFIVAQIQDKIYGLALRFLWHPEDARDATQEILIRVITHLGGFRFESAFTTWVYRVAANYLIKAHQSRLERQNYTFVRFGVELDEGLSDQALQIESDVEKTLLLEEIKIGCTLAMLLCLDRPHRLAYILGDILELPGNDAAQILEITAEAFRKRLSRARTEVVSFMKLKCGLVNPENRCRCRRRLNQAVKMKRVDSQNLLFAHDLNSARNFPEVLNQVRALEETQRAVALYRSHPEPASPEDFVPFVRKLVMS